MATTTFEYCSLHYLNLWLENDMKYCHALATGDRTKKLNALREAAVAYSVARTLPSELDGSARYEPILDIIDPLRPTRFEDRPVEEIRKIERQISREYGGRNVLSATTKFLWIKIKQPILIFDSRARNAFGIRNNDGLEEFYGKWRAGFEANQGAIVNACSKLPAINKYAVNQEVATKEYIREISDQTWFHERVFDTYLWNKGGNIQMVELNEEMRAN
jgi:hypothetical protein